MNILRRKKYTWIEATGTIFVYYDHAESVLKGLKRRYPERKWRIYGHGTSGYHIQVRAEVR
jgi:hypothetical protein